jgi:hypothetical protein
VQGSVELLEQGFDDRPLERGGKVGAVLLRDRVAQVTQAVQQRGLEAAEAVLQAGQRRFGQRLPVGVALAGEAVEGGAAGEAEAEHARRLVEGLAGRVVAGAADDLEASVLRHPDHVRVRPADHQPKQGWLEVGAGQHRGVDVAPQVVDSGQGPVPGRGQSLGHAHADEQAADQARAAGHRQLVEVGGSDACPLEGEVEQLGQALEVVAGGELGDDAAEVPVQVDLRVDDVGQDLATVLDDRDGSLVAGRLDAEGEAYQSPLVRSSRRSPRTSESMRSRLASYALRNFGEWMESDHITIASSPLSV